MPLAWIAVDEVLDVGAGERPQRLPRHQRHVAVDDELVHAVRLDAVKDVKVAELSYGQQRQLEIGMALAGAPLLERQGRGVRLTDAAQVLLEHADEVAAAYRGRKLKFGPDYIIPRPFDPRLLTIVAPAVAPAAPEETTDWRQMSGDMLRSTSS